jgi:predicted short-subunit dehydrogenase-like oxidoreductase (DUF2520 family)
VIGAGCVGTTLASLLHRSGNKIVAVVSRNKRSAAKCGRAVSCRNCSDDVSVIPSSCDLVIIAVPDQSIRSVAQSLGALPHLQFKKIYMCHTSGAITSDVLDPVANKGARVFSLHPVQTFPRQNSLHEQIASMKGITYGVEGPTSSRGTAKTLVRHLGGEILFIPKEAKILYHLACVVASNYPVTLVGALEAVAGKFTRKTIRPFRKLLQTSIENAIRMGAKRALTGPIARGDSEIVSEHLNELQDPELKMLYKVLGTYALKLAIEDKRLQSDEIARLEELLVTKQ